jgi:hypothetical protein
MIMIFYIIVALILLPVVITALPYVLVLGVLFAGIGLLIYNPGLFIVLLLIVILITICKSKTEEHKKLKVKSLPIQVVVDFEKLKDAKRDKKRYDASWHGRNTLDKHLDIIA